MFRVLPVTGAAAQCLYLPPVEAPWRWGTESVPETLQEFFTLMRLAAREDLLETGQTLLVPWVTGVGSGCWSIREAWLTRWGTWVLISTVAFFVSDLKHEVHNEYLECSPTLTRLLPSRKVSCEAESCSSDSDFWTRSNVNTGSGVPSANAIDRFIILGI
jgi:hypothetical protein